MASPRKGKAPPVAVPRLTPPAKRGLIGGLYSAKLLFEFCVFVAGDPGKRRLCEARLILVEAPTARDALRQATKQGRASQHRYKNSDGNPVHFRLVGVLDLCHLGVECEPNEVWYAIGERVTPMERRRILIPKASDLSAIRNERSVKRT